MLPEFVLLFAKAFSCRPIVLIPEAVWLGFGTDDRLDVPSKLRSISTESSLEMIGKLRAMLRHQSTKYHFNKHTTNCAEIVQTWWNFSASFQTFSLDVTFGITSPRNKGHNSRFKSVYVIGQSQLSSQRSNGFFVSVCLSCLSCLSVFWFMSVCLVIPVCLVIHVCLVIRVCLSCHFRLSVQSVYALVCLILTLIPACMSASVVSLRLSLSLSLSLSVSVSLSLSPWL